MRTKILSFSSLDRNHHHVRIILLFRVRIRFPSSGDEIFIIKNVFFRTFFCLFGGVRRDFPFLMVLRGCLAGYMSVFACCKMHFKTVLSLSLRSSRCLEYELTLKLHVY